VLLEKAVKSPVENARLLALYDGTPQSTSSVPHMALYSSDAPEDAALYGGLTPCSVDRARR
jgi:hypothetical protein